MARPKKRRGLPKTTGDWEALSGEQVIEKVFGKRGQRVLKQQAEKPPNHKRRKALPT